MDACNRVTRCPVYGCKGAPFPLGPNLPGELCRAHWENFCIDDAQTGCYPTVAAWLKDVNPQSWRAHVYPDPELKPLSELYPASRARTCDCGAEKARTPHARWCSTKEGGGDADSV